ncbi:hypothetical protein LCGC14_1860440 [marine sediment metagenome]|uniref:Uncharacterized protein n=1 Tax=marine sediment metagenome TaxID=412755 RepID=A0A0F9G7N5_9ZZZZ
MSKKIDQVIEEEKAIKAELSDHPRYTPMRVKLDNNIRNLRWTKKTALKLWREIKRDPVITP